jgi:hypothetical protein
MRILINYSCIVSLLVWSVNEVMQQFMTKNTGDSQWSTIDLELH